MINVDCTDGDIRLVDGSNELEGRVEVCVDGAWGTVCSDLWGSEEASIACRQLGFSQTGIANQIMYIIIDELKVWLSCTCIVECIADKYLTVHN